MWPRLFKRFDGSASTLQGQLRDMLVHAVMEGFISPGQALPSSRLLAQALGLSRTTVTLALQALVDKGLFVARARSGLYVSEQLQSTYLGARWRAHAAAHPAAGPAPATTGVRWDERLKLRPSTQRNIEKPRDWQQQPYPFIYGQFDASLFPSTDWRECVLESLQGRRLRRWAPDHIDRDDDSLVEQIHRRLLPARGIWAEPEQILVTAGAQQATFLLATLLLGPTTVVGIENPGYPDARNNFLLRSRHVRALRVDEQGLVLGTALTGCRVVYVTPSHQCPTTVTMSLQRRQDLLARAERDDFVVIEDDHESELNFSGQPTPALKSLDSQERVIYIGSLSKTMAHGLRLGYVVAPVVLTRELRALRRLVMRHVATNNQQAAASFIGHGHQEAFVRRLNIAYRERAQALRTALAQHAPGLVPAAAHGGSALWVSADKGVDTRALAARLYRQGVVVEPGDVFFGGARPPRQHLRIGYSSIALERIEGGACLIGQELAAMRMPA
ncbi:MAG: PLP-dependent aminotransferase family protein [Rubrivivax sp.]|nr:PLP-dependent aminotransferase family protein [Rubrivivax sp.]